jgi:hypothetical protein
MIDSKKLTSGQFIYHNLQNNIMKEGFAVELVKDEDFNIDEINNLPEPEKLIKGREDTNKLKELAVIIAEMKAEEDEKEEENKNFKQEIGSYVNRKVVKRDYWKEAEEIYNKTITDSELKEEPTLNLSKSLKTEIKEEPKEPKKDKPKINIAQAMKIQKKKKKEKVSKEELTNFIDNIEEKKDEIDNQIKEEPIIINTDELEAKVKAQMNAEKIEYEEDCDF